MNQDYVSTGEFAGHAQVSDERFRRDKERLDKHEEAIDRIVRLDERFGVIIERHDETIKEHDNRIGVLEKQDGEKWNKTKSSIVGMLISVIGGGIIGAILTAVLESKK